MYSTHLFFCFVVIGGGLASPQNGGDLQLERVFRTPKDFSKVNFDHFEILERNNFDNTPTTTSRTDVEQNTIDHPPKSVANAQVMLRFGGDNMQNCQGLPSSISPRFKVERPCEQPDTCNPLCPKSINVVAAPTIYPYTDYRYPAYPYVPTNPIASQYASQYGYTYPPTPYSFPGYYYGVPPYLSNPYGLYNGQLIPSEEVEVCEKTIPCEKIDSCEKIDCCEKITSCEKITPCEDITPCDLIAPCEKIVSCEKIVPCEKIIPCEDSCETKESFLDCGKPLKPPPCGSCPKILHAKVLSDEKILNVNIPDIQSVPKLYVKDKIYLTNDGQTIIEETLVPERPEVVKIRDIDCSCIDPNPCSHKLSYVEENIREAVKEQCKIPKQNIETLLDQALVPLTCNKCQSKQRLLVSYPISSCGKEIVTIPEGEIIIPKCSCCEKQGVCGCCRERNCSIPYGKRFSADIDSLLEVLPSSPQCGCRYIPPVLYKSNPCDAPCKIYPTIRDPCCNTVPIDVCDAPCAAKEIAVVAPCQEPIIPLRTPRVLNQVVSVPPTSSPSVINQVVNVPPAVYGGYNRLPEPYYTSTLPRLERPEVLVDEIGTPGAEYYSDSLKSIIYKEPSITNVINFKNPGVPVVEGPNIVKFLPKYDVCPREEIGTLDIPDLVPTNRYLCAKCNNCIPPSTVCNREYLPVERRVPLIRPYLPSLVRDVPVIREGPIATNYVSRRYCPTCAKYTGELNELNE